MRVRGLLLALALTAGGCGGAAAEQVRLGDARARASDWDAAADAYAKALRFGSDDDVKAKLSFARRWQVNARLGRGEPEHAWPLAREALALAPESSAALELLREVGRRLGAHAERAFAAGDLERTGRLLELAAEWGETAEATRGLRARLDERLAERAYARAEAEQTAGLRALAALEFAAADGHRRGFRDALARAASLREGLVAELTYHVVVGAFEADETAAELARGLTPTGVARALPAGARVRVHSARPEGPTLGLRLGGALESYRFARDVRSEARSCSYVCGQDRRPNPELAPLEARASSAEGVAAAARQGAGFARSAVDDRRRERERAERDGDEARRDLERARADLDRCARAGEKAGGGRCEGARAEADSGARRLEAIEARLRPAGAALEAARAELLAAERRLEAAIAEAAAARSALERTPRSVLVDRSCLYSYRVETHTREAAVGVRVAASALAGDEAVLDERLEPLRVARSDATFAPRAGYCAEVAAGDPLELPAEEQFKDWLLDEAHRAVGRRVLEAYERERGVHLRAAREHARSGRRAQAAEAYLRWLLTSPSRPDGPNEREALASAAGAAGASDERVRAFVATPLPEASRQGLSGARRNVQA